MRPAPGMVRTQAHMMRSVMPQRTAVMRRDAPTPQMAPVITCVVLTGMPARAVPISVSAAAVGAAKNMPDDFRVSITDAPGKTAYPICSFTWLLIPEKIPDATKRDAIKGFVTWMLTDGQSYAEGLSYAKLPKEVVEKEKKAINLIQ